LPARIIRRRLVRAGSEVVFVHDARFDNCVLGSLAHRFGDNLGLASQLGGTR
jgi:hypothetical protein